MTKYEILLSIIDQIRKEGAQNGFTKYLSAESNVEQINNARSRAFIHLFLKVSFGLLDFKEREHYITDNSYDGGIDGYYINHENKVIYFVQSKFRTTSLNFENKKIALEEILVMDINRILDGDKKDEAGNDIMAKYAKCNRKSAKLRILHAITIGSSCWRILIKLLILKCDSSPGGTAPIYLTMKNVTTSYCSL